MCLSQSIQFSPPSITATRIVKCRPTHMVPQDWHNITSAIAFISQYDAQFVSVASPFFMDGSAHEVAAAGAVPDPIACISPANAIANEAAHLLATIPRPFVGVHLRSLEGGCAISLVALGLAFNLSAEEVIALSGVCVPTLHYIAQFVPTALMDAVPPLAHPRSNATTKVLGYERPDVHNDIAPEGLALRLALTAPIPPQRQWTTPSYFSDRAAIVQPAIVAQMGSVLAPVGAFNEPDVNGISKAPMDASLALPFFVGMYHNARALLPPDAESRTRPVVGHLSTASRTALRKVIRLGFDRSLTRSADAAVEWLKGRTYLAWDLQRSSLREAMPIVAHGGYSSSDMRISPYSSEGAMVDFFVLAEADVFVGNVGSTLSVNVCRHRLLRGKGCDSFPPAILSAMGPHGPSMTMGVGRLT